MKFEGAERTWAEFGALSQLDEAAIQPFQLGAALLGDVRDIVLGEGRCGHFRGSDLHKCREVEAGDAVNGAAPRALGLLGLPLAFGGVLSAVIATFVFRGKKWVTLAVLVVIAGAMDAHRRDGLSGAFAVLLRRAW